MNQLLQNLNQKLASLNQGEESIVKVNASVSDKLVAYKSKPPPIQRDILTICNDPYTLAQQLTHVELVSLPADTQHWDTFIPVNVANEIVP